MPFGTNAHRVSITHKQDPRASSCVSVARSRVSSATLHSLHSTPSTRTRGGDDATRAEVVSASCRARRRAGRVREGYCYHLVSSVKYEALEEYQVPEMLRVPLDGLVLQIKMLGLGEALAFLGMAIQPPEGSAVAASVDLLRQIGALDAQHGISIAQSIMQFIGHEQHGLTLKHGFMHGRKQAVQATSLRVTHHFDNDGLVN